MFKEKKKRIDQKLERRHRKIKSITNANMSFFIKSKNNNATKKDGTKRKSKGNKPEKKRKKLSNIHVKDNEEDELTSSSDDEVIPKSNVEEEEDDDLETAQEKKLKLAKIYLEEIERQERERLEDKNAHRDFNDDIIAKRLKEDRLKEIGRFKTRLADNVIGYDTTNKKLLRCKEQKNVVTCLCITTDDRYLFSGSKCGVIVKWSLNNYEKCVSLPFVKKRTIGEEKRANVGKNRKINDGKRTNRGGEAVIGHSAAISSIAVSSDSKYVVSGDELCNVHVWDINLRHLHTFKGHKGAVRGVVFRRDTHTLYTCSDDRSVKVWSLDEMSYVETLYGHQDAITSIDASTRERAITAGGRDATIRIWKIAEESQLVFSATDGASVDVVRLIDEDTFVSGGDDGRLSLWSIARKKPLCVVDEVHGNERPGQPYWIASIGSLLNTDLLATGSRNGTIKMWKYDANRKKLIDLRNDYEVDGYVNSLKFTSDGKRLIAAIGREHRLGRWDVVKTVKNNIVVIPLLNKSQK